VKRGDGVMKGSAAAVREGTKEREGGRERRDRVRRERD